MGAVIPLKKVLAVSVSHQEGAIRTALQQVRELGLNGGTEYTEELGILDDAINELMDLRRHKTR